MCRLDTLHCQGESALASPRPGLDGLHCTLVRGQDRFAAELRVSVVKRGETRGVAGESTCCFFQAEDGIRYLTVTGVQTCALPISALFWRQVSETPAARSSDRTLARSIPGRR